MMHLLDVEKFKHMQHLPILNQPSSFSNLKICVLQPDYSTSGVDYQNYDPKRNLSSILPDAVILPIQINLDPNKRTKK